ARAIRSRLEVSQAQDLDPGAAHLIDRAVDVAGLEIDAADAVDEKRGLEPELDRIERARAHAVVGRQPADDELLDPSVAKPILEPCSMAARVVEEGAVAVDARILALRDHVIEARRIDARREGRARRALDAVDGPKDLLEPVEDDAFAGRPS